MVKFAGIAPKKQNRQTLIHAQITLFYCPFLSFYSLVVTIYSQWMEVTDNGRVGELAQRHVIQEHKQEAEHVIHLTQHIVAKVVDY